MIATSELVCAYGDKTVLHGVSLEVPPGSTAVLIGPSGCGKSTLLKAVTGLVWPRSGEVVVGGTVVTPASVGPLRRRLGYVIQEGGLFPHLTARANVMLVPRTLGWDRGRQEQRLEELAGLVQLELELMDRFPVQLSGGQRQRVGLMRALVLDPDVILLDEPLGALDPMVRAELQEELRRIFQSLGKTVLMVTHDLEEAGYLGDQVVLLDEGRVVQRGSLDDLLHRPATPFVTRFVRAQRRDWGEP